jgi:hypothetical protein
VSEHALVLHKAESFQVSAIIGDVDPEAAKRFFEFFTVPQEFQIGFGRKVLPDWVIASRARI